uniref:Si:dkey-177p2.6 n=1 Tax=Myripristis murdjan TaxID=586833 RepID=A0A667YKZ8_9TELE
MLGRGVKRKWSCLEDHVQQRQLVLGLCLEKLQRCQAGVELSLRRSVLLINTLRQIQEEMRSDGSDAQFDTPLDAADPDSRLLRCDIPVTCPGCAEGDKEGPSPPSVLPSLDTNSSPSPSKSLPAATHSTLSDAVNAVGYLSDLALDDIFEDIDTSMYETSDLVAGSFWPVSVSLWAEEEVKVRSAGPASAGTLQSCLMDLNELDHIMEILVKS